MNDDQSIRNLHLALDAKFAGRVSDYGSSRNELHGYAFKITGIDASFSVITLDGTLPLDQFDIQIESCPPEEAGDYIYTDKVSLSELMELIPMYETSIDSWPGVD